jgi:hypothetical protein
MGVGFALSIAVRRFFTRFSKGRRCKLVIVRTPTKGSQMKISKALAATGLVLALSLGSAASASASELAPSNYPITSPVTETPDTEVSKDVKPKDRKAVDSYRKIKKAYEQKQANYAAKVEFKAAMTAWKEAMTAWETTNASLLASLKAIKTNFNTSVKATETAYAASMAAAKTAADPQVARAYARATKAAEIAAAVKSRNEAIAALGVIPAKPVKPENDGKGKVKGKGDHGKGKGKKND